MSAALLEYGAVTVALNAALVKNNQHTLLASIAQADWSNDQLIKWLKKERLQFPVPILLVRFIEGEFSNERLEFLLDMGFDSYIVGIPSALLIEKICSNIDGTIVRSSGIYGKLVLKGSVFHCRGRTVTFPKKELTLFRTLLLANSVPVHKEQCLKIHGYVQGAKTHTVETHIGRLRRKLQVLGLENVLSFKKHEGYTLFL